MPAVRLDSLTGLRWWAAFAVFMFHMRIFAPLPIEVFELGHLGVAFFFILSGFVLTWSARPGVAPTTFWFRRFARIWPAHMVALLLAIPVFYSFSPDPDQSWVKPVSVGILLLSVVLLQGWSNNPTILFSGNPAAWTLTCEAFFYALHPALNRVLVRVSRRGALYIAIGVVVLAFAYRALALLPDSPLGVVPVPVARVTEFILGMAIARAMIAGWTFRVPPIATYALGAVAVLLLSVGQRFEALHPLLAVLAPFTNEIFIVVFALVLTAVAARDQRGGFSLLRSKVLVALGDMSFAFYLVHATVMYTALALLGYQAVGWSNLVWYLPLALVGIGVAALLHYFVEKPLERRMRGWMDRRVARKAAIATAT